MAAGSFRLPTSSSTPSGGWQRPSDWLPMPAGITSANQTFVGLHAVIENSDNYVAFRFTTSAGQYQVDWGDGSTPTLHDSNAIAQYQYNFATVSNSTLTSRGYKQSIITVTPVSGNLLTCDFNLRFVTSPVQNQIYSTGFLDCILSMPNASSGSSILWNASTQNVRHAYVERFDIKTIGGCTTMGNMFNNCLSLQSVPLFNTASVTNMSNMFFSCRSLQSVPLFNTASVTSINSMFQNCSSLQSVPLFNTANVNNMSTMFSGCSSINSIPTFVLSAFTLASGTSTSFANSSNSLNRCQIVFRRSVGFSNCQLSRDAIVEIFNNLADRSATTSQTITITGNWGVSALSAGDLAIATGKNWVVTT